MIPLERYRDAHAGADCIICGCGASLAGFEPPPDAITIGVNDMARAFDPDYLVVLNPMHSFSVSRKRVIAQTRANAVFSHLDLGRLRAPLVRFRLGQRGGVGPPGAGLLHYTRNSPYAAVHLAALMGAKRIGLIGVDFTDHHFFAQTGTHGLARALPLIDAEYGVLAQALRDRGITLDNLSPISRLTALPRRAGVSTPEDLVMPTSSTRHLVIPRTRSGPAGQLMDALATSARSLGHSVTRATTPQGHKDIIAITWNGRSLRWDGPTIYCEHGWLPRSAYQISTHGINADSHIAPFAWTGTALPAGKAARIEATLSQLRRDARMARSGSAPKRPFYLVPLQMEYDTNLVRHAPPELRRMQSLIDRLSAADPPLPLVFKQHPADLRRGARHMSLRVRRKQDQLWRHAKGCVNTLLASGHCAGILSVNSNVVHDGLVHGVPALVLGRNIWPSGGDAPFLTQVPTDWETLDRHLECTDVRAARLAYAGHLIDAQWTLADARTPAKLAALLGQMQADTPSVQAAASKPRLTAAPRALTPRGTRRPARVSAPATARTPRAEINIFARNHGWRFEEVKKQLIARARARGLPARASDRPQRDAGAWIAIRAAEAGLTPDPARTLVQIHDLANAATYAPGAPRAAVATCSHVQLAHDGQLAILRSLDAFADAAVLPVLPPGAAQVTDQPRQPAEPFTVGWFGRPEQHGARERHRPDMFTSALCAMGGDVAALLAGDRLAPHAEILRAAGVATTLKPTSACPLAHWPRLLRTCHALVLTSEYDPAPPMLFEALARGIPVLARPIGWARDLLDEAQHIETTDQITQALTRLRTGTEQPTPMHLDRNAWLDQALDAAQDLAARHGRAGAIAAE